MEFFEKSSSSVSNKISEVRARNFMQQLAESFNGKSNPLSLNESLNNPDFVAFALLKNPSLFNYIPESYQNDRDFILKVIKSNRYSQYEPGTILDYVSDKFTSDKEFMSQAIDVNSSVLRYASEDIKNDSSFVLEVVKKNGYALADASDEIRNNKNIVIEALKNAPDAVKYASEILKNDIDIAIFVGDNQANKYLTHDARKEASIINKEITNRNNKIEEFIKNNPSNKYNLFEKDGLVAKAPEKRKQYSKIPKIQNTNEILELMRDFYKGVEERPTLAQALKDPIFVLDIVKKDAEYLQYASEEIKNNKEIVLEAVKNDGRSLKYASESLKSDREVVLNAVKNDGNSLYYASELIKSDREVVLEAVKNDGRSLQSASKNLKNDKEVVYYAVKNDSNALRYASVELQEYTLENGVDKIINPDISTRINDVLGKFRTFLKPSENTAARKFG